MNEKELKAFKKTLLDQRRNVLRSKKASQEFLEKLGILTPKGNLTKKFKALHK